MITTEDNTRHPRIDGWVLLRREDVARVTAYAACHPPTPEGAVRRAIDAVSTALAAAHDPEEETS